MNTNQLKNIKSLCLINLKKNKNLFWAGFALLMVLFGLDLLLILINFFPNSNGLQSTNITTYSSYALGLSILFSIITTLKYNKNNISNEVFPNDNRSKLSSYIIVNFIFLLSFLILSTLLYLLMVLTLTIINSYTKDLIFAYNKNILFTITGFFVNLSYGAMAILTVVLIGVLDRKFNFYFRIFLSVLIALIFVFSNLGNTLLNAISNFYMGEAYLSLFFLKTSVTTVLFLVLSLFINKHTNYFEGFEEKNRKPLMISLIIIMVVLCGSMGKLYIKNTMDYYRTGFLQDYTTSLFGTNPDRIFEYDNMKIDISSINKEEPLNICKGEKLKEQSSDFTHTYAPAKVTTSDTLYIEYQLPENTVNGIDTLKFLNVKLIYTLEGNNLTIDYDYDKDKHVIFCSPYNNMTYFKTFIGKEYCSSYKHSISSQLPMSVKIYNGKGITIIENSL